MEQKASVTPNPSPTNREGGLQTVLPTLARLFRTEILVLLLIFAVFNFFKLSNFFIAIDDDFEVFRSNGFNWILTGRWASYLFLRYLTPQPILPFFPTFIFGLGLALSYPLLLSCFGVRRLSAVHYLAFPLYAGFPTWMYLTSLTAASCWAGVAQLFVVMAVHRFHAILGVLDSDSSRSRSWFAMQGLLCGLALAIALGFYQAFVATYVVLGLAVLLVRHRSSPIPFWRVTRHSLALGGSTILGIILYEIIDYGFRHIFGIFSTSYLTEFLNLHALFESPLGVLGRSFLFGGAIYAGHTPIYATDSFSFPVILASGLAAIALWRGRSGNARIVAIMLAGGILLVPIVQPLLNGGGMPLRTLVAVPSVFWLFGMLGLTSEVRTIALIALAAVTIGLLQVLYASGLYFAAGHFARIHDQQLAAAVYARIADVNPELESTKTYSVDFFGARPFQTHYPRPPSSTAGYSFFEWDGGNEERILDYMRLIGYTNLRAPSPQQRKQDLAIFQQMPVWPARNSVRVAGDVTLIKLGPTPGYPFNTQ